VLVLGLGFGLALRTFSSRLIWYGVRPSLSCSGLGLGLGLGVRLGLSLGVGVGVGLRLGPNPAK